MLNASMFNVQGFGGPEVQGSEVQGVHSTLIIDY